MVAGPAPDFNLNRGDSLSLDGFTHCLGARAVAARSVIEGKEDARRSEMGS